MNKIIVVTPVYEDAQASRRLFKELHMVFGTRVFVVAVDDGSVSEKLEPDSLSVAGVDGVVIKLRRNVGHQRAIAIGLSYVANEMHDVASVVVMDSDGEDLPQSIPPMIQLLDSPDVDIVVAERRSRRENLGFRLFYQLYLQLFRLFSGHRIKFGNFMVMKLASAKRLIAMQETWVHLAASVLTSKLRIVACPLDRGPRYAGESRMNFVGLALHGFRALMVFAEDVLLRVGVASTIVAMLSLLSGLTAIGLKLFGFATPGWATVVLGVMLLVFLQTGALTLMSLMLSGVMRSGSVTTIDYRNFIDEIIDVGHSTAR